MLTAITHLAEDISLFCSFHVFNQTEFYQRNNWDLQRKSVASNHDGTKFIANKRYIPMNIDSINSYLKKNILGCLLTGILSNEIGDRVHYWKQHFPHSSDSSVGHLSFFSVRKNYPHVS